MTEPSEAALRLMHKLRTYGQFSEFAVPDRQAAIEIDRFAVDRLAQRDERIRRLEAALREIIPLAETCRKEAVTSDGRQRAWGLAKEIGQLAATALDAGNGERGE